MGSLLKKAQKIADPANIFGGRPGGFSMADAIDPGGAIIKTVTGSDIGRKIADPGKLYSQQELTIKQAGMSAAAKKTEQAKKDKLARYKKLRTQPRTIMSTDLQTEDTLG